MNLHKKTIEKLGDTVVRFGEVSTISGVATLFVSGFPLWVSLMGLIVGSLLILAGLYIVEQSEIKGV